MKKRTAALTALCAAALCACLAGCAKEMTPEDLAGAPEGAAAFCGGVFFMPFFRDRPSLFHKTATKPHHFPHIPPL